MSEQKSDPGKLNLRLPGRLAIMGSGCFSPFVVACTVPLLPAIAAYFKDVPNSAMLTRLLVTIVGVTIAIGSPMVGRFSDRWGPRRIFSTSITAFALAGLAGFWIENLYLLLAARVVVGLSLAAIGAIVLVLIVRYSTGGAANRWFGYITLIPSASAVVLMPIIGHLGTFGWHWPFLCYLVLLPLAVLAWKGLDPDPPYVPPAEKEASPGFIAALRSSASSVGYLIFALAAGSTLVTPHIYFPFHLRDIGAGDPELIAWAMIPCNFLGAVASYFYGTIRTRVSLPVMFVLVFSSIAIGLVVAGLAQTYWGVIFGTVIFSLGLGSCAPNLYALAAVTGPENLRSQTLGLAKTGIFAGPLVGQAFFEPINSRFGAGGALIGIAVVAAVLLLWQFRSIQFRRAATA
jgi:MFS family permease